MYMLYIPIIVYRRNKYLRDLIGDINIESNKVFGKQKLILKGNYCKPWFSRTNKLLYRQLLLKAMSL